MDKLIKRWLHFGAGVTVPAVQIDQPETVIVETSLGKRIPSQFANCISLREPNPNGENAGGDPYLRLTRENLGFTTLRFNVVPGLDVDASTGEILGIEKLEQLRAASIVARQQARAEQLAPAEFVIDAAAAAE